MPEKRERGAIHSVSNNAGEPVALRVRAARERASDLLYTVHPTLLMNMLIDFCVASLCNGEVVSVRVWEGSTVPRVIVGELRCNCEFENSHFLGTRVRRFGLELCFRSSDCN